jgi:hypothetical protein
MISYFNLPSAQRRTQRIVDQFNAAEELWRSLETKRLRRRELLSGPVAGASKVTRLTRFRECPVAAGLYRFRR